MGEKYIKEVKPGTYRISIRCGKTIDGKNLYITKQISNSTLAKAKKVRDELLKEKDSVMNVDGNIKFIDYARSYLLEHVSQTHNGSTLDGEESKIRNHIIPYLGDYKMKDITPVVVQKLVNYLATIDSKKHDSNGNIVKLSPTTIKNVYNILRGMFAKAVKLRIIAENPCSGITLPRRKKYIPAIYTLEEMEQVLKCLLESNLPIQKKCIFVLALSTGLRRGELCGIMVKDIDLNRKILYVKNSISQTKSMGEELKGPKTKSGVREVGLNDLSIEIIKLQLEDIKKRQKELGNDWKNAPTLFVDSMGGYVSINSITSSWHRFIKKYNLKPVALKGLRTSFASFLANQNVPPKVVQTLLGHASERTTMQYYEFAYDNYATKIINKTNMIGKNIKIDKK